MTSKTVCGVLAASYGSGSDELHSEEWAGVCRDWIGCGMCAGKGRWEGYCLSHSDTHTFWGSSLSRLPIVWTLGYPFV